MTGCSYPYTEKSVHALVLKVSNSWNRPGNVFPAGEAPSITLKHARASVLVLRGKYSYPDRAASPTARKAIR